MASVICMASIHKKRGLFQKLNKEATSVLKIQQEEMDAQTQMLFCLMLIHNDLKLCCLLTLLLFFVLPFKLFVNHQTNSLFSV